MIQEVEENAAARKQRRLTSFAGDVKAKGDFEVDLLRAQNEALRALAARQQAQIRTILAGRRSILEPFGKSLSGKFKSLSGKFKVVKEGEGNKGKGEKATEDKEDDQQGKGASKAKYVINDAEAEDKNEEGKGVMQTSSTLSARWRRRSTESATGFPVLSQGSFKDLGFNLNRGSVVGRSSVANALQDAMGMEAVLNADVSVDGIDFVRVVLPATETFVINTRETVGKALVGEQVSEMIFQLSKVRDQRRSSEIMEHVMGDDIAVTHSLNPPAGRYTHNAGPLHHRAAGRRLHFVGGHRAVERDGGSLVSPPSLLPATNHRASSTTLCSTLRYHAHWHLFFCFRSCKMLDSCKDSRACLTRGFSRFTPPRLSSASTSSFGESLLRTSFSDSC